MVPVPRTPTDVLALCWQYKSQHQVFAFRLWVEALHRVFLGTSWCHNNALEVRRYLAARVHIKRPPDTAVWRKWSDGTLLRAFLLVGGNGHPWKSWGLTDIMSNLRLE